MRLGQIEIRQQQPILQLVGGALVARRLEQDLQVLLHQRILLARERRLVLRRHGVQVGHSGVHGARPDIEDLRIVALNTPVRSMPSGPYLACTSSSASAALLLAATQAAAAIRGGEVTARQPSEAASVVSLSIVVSPVGVGVTARAAGGDCTQARPRLPRACGRQNESAPSRSVRLTGDPDSVSARMPARAARPARA